MSVAPEDYEVFRDAFRELGYVQGRSIGDPESLPRRASALLAVDAVWSAWYPVLSISMEEAFIRSRTIPFVGDFQHYFAITRACIGIELALFVVLNLVSAVVESIGILLFIPFLAQLSGPSTPHSGTMSRLLVAVLAYCNIPTTIGYTVGLLVVVFVLKGVTVFVVNAYQQWLLNRVRQRLRDRLIALYSDVDYRYALDQTAGFFGNLVVSETDRACVAMDAFCHVLSSLIAASVFVSVALFLHSFLSAFMLLAVGVSFVILRSLSAQARHYSIQVSSLSARLNDFLIQALQSFKYLKATARFSVLRARLARVADEDRRTQNKLAYVNAAVLAVHEPLLVICLAWIFYYAVVIGQRDMASVMVSVLFFYRCMVEMGHLNRHWHWVVSRAGALEAVWTTTRELEHHREHRASADDAPFREKLEFRDVSYGYGSQPVLQAVNLTIAKNTAVAFVGASGVGKTTLVDVLTGVLKPTRGMVCVDGRDLHTLNLFRYRESVGYVEQNTVLFDDTVANNISMQSDPATEATWARIRQAARSGNCEEFIERLPLGYDTMVGERGLRLSGGQRQRLAIARELYRQPAILILDEATSSLDSQAESHIQETLARLKGTVTLVIISHRLSTIRSVDYIYVIEQGRVIEEGTFAELARLEGSTFRRMCELQSIVPS